jgi:hypothetical protein
MIANVVTQGKLLPASNRLSWTAVRMIGEAVPRTQSADAANAFAYIKGPEVSVA